jgi:2-haloacid dehalogenase/putative hydrolase of the HAD superfamily
MGNRTYDVVFVDFYGTLAAGDKETVELTCRGVVDGLQLPMTPPELAILWGERFFEALAVSNHDQFRTLYECEQHSLRETVRPFVGEIDPVPFVAGMEEYWRRPPLHDDVVAFLAALDRPVCCVSNADAEPLRQAIAHHGLRFDGVISSEEARSYKPDSTIFDNACELMGVSPARVIHIGDSLHSDIGGASGRGISTAWLNRPQRIHDIGRCLADFTVSSLTDLIPLLSNGREPR